MRPVLMESSLKLKLERSGSYSNGSENKKRKKVIKIIMKKKKKTTETEWGVDHKSIS